VFREAEVFANISLTRNAVVERISDISANLNSQLKNKVKSFVTFSVALDESTDISNVAQLATLIRGVDETLSVTEEFLGLVLMMDTTTDNHIFNSLLAVLNRVGVDWSRAVSIATDRAPSMIGKKAGFVPKLRDKAQVVRGGRELRAFHSISQQEALCCKSLKWITSCKWLSGQLISSEPEVLITVSLTVFSSEKVLQASLPVTIRRCTENKLAEISSRLRQPEQIQKDYSQSKLTIS